MDGNSHFTYIKYFMEDQETNQLLVDSLKLKLEKNNYEVEYGDRSDLLLVNSNILIETAIPKGSYHPSTLPVNFIAKNEKHFPNGITSNLVGFGDTKKQKIETICNKYLNEILIVLVDSFSDEKSKHLKKSISNTHNSFWLPIVSENIYEGTLSKSFEKRSLFSIIKSNLIDKSTDKSFNWIQLSIIWNLSGNIRCESYFNGEWWTEGYDLIKSYAESQKNMNHYFTQKQFIVLKELKK